MMDVFEDHSVSIYIYDISKGFAKAMSAMLLGKQLDGIWHTAVVVYGQEFFFGGNGIQSCDPGTTILQQPDKIEQLGTTQIPYDMFMDYIHELSTSSFGPEKYHLLNHNCNTFTSEVAQFLTGSSIPSYITDLPQEFLNTPLGAMVKPYLDALTVSPSGGSSIGAQSQITSSSSKQHMSPDTASVRPQSVEGEVTCSDIGRAEARCECGNQSEQGPPNSPTTYKELKLAQQEYTEVKESLKSLLSSREVQLLDEILEYIMTDEPLWGLGANHVAVIDKILRGKQFTEGQKKAVGGLLQECLYHIDVIMMLRHDADNTYFRILTSFEQQSMKVKEKMAKGLCNCGSIDKGLEWLLKEDHTPNNGIGSVAVDVCRCCLLDNEKTLNDVGAALSQSVTRKKISAELAVDLGCAIVELLQKDTWIETVKNGIWSLCQCIKSNSEVAAVAVVSGLDPDVLVEKYPELRDLCINYLKNHLSLI